MSHGNTSTQEIARLRGELEYVSRAISTTARKLIRDRVDTALAYKLPETAIDEAQRLREYCRELEARNAYMQITINQLHRGEFICSQCQLRQDGERPDEQPF